MKLLPQGSRAGHREEFRDIEVAASLKCGGVALEDERVRQFRDIIALRSIALGFGDALKADRSPQLLQWIAKAKRCELRPVVRFAYRWQKDISAA